MKLIFVRHGYPDYETDSLTPLGHEQAARTADRLASEPINAIYSSPYGRARQTAAPTAEKLGLPVQILDFMHEVDWHPIVGTESEKSDWQIYHPWIVSRQLVKKGIDLCSIDYNTLDCWSNSTLKGCYERIVEESNAWLAGLGYERKEHGYVCIRENEDTIVLFAHHGSGTCLFAHLLNLPLLALFAGCQYNFTGITMFSFSGQPGEFVIPEVVCYNDHAHVDSCETPLMR